MEMHAFTLFPENVACMHLPYFLKIDPILSGGSPLVCPWKCIYKASTSRYCNQAYL